MLASEQQPVSKLEVASATVDPMIAGTQVGGFALINADSKQYGLLPEFQIQAMHGCKLQK